MSNEVNEVKHENANFTITVKINAKGESYGEYTVKADDADTLAERLDAVKQLFYSSL